MAGSEPGVLGARIRPPRDRPRALSTSRRLARWRTASLRFRPQRGGKPRGPPVAVLARAQLCLVSALVATVVPSATGRADLADARGPAAGFTASAGANRDLGPKGSTLRLGKPVSQCPQRQGLISFPTGVRWPQPSNLLLAVNRGDCRGAAIGSRRSSGPRR